MFTLHPGHHMVFIIINMLLAAVFSHIHHKYSLFSGHDYSCVLHPSLDVSQPNTSGSCSITADHQHSGGEEAERPKLTCADALTQVWFGVEFNKVDYVEHVR